MTVLLAPEALSTRATVVDQTPELRALRRSLRDDLSPLLRGEAPWIPPDKARMTRVGGRCPVHGTLLEFDPWAPRAHRCPACGVAYREEEHYRWWIMNYQLWLAERAVHAAAIAAVSPDPACEGLAGAILLGYARAYAQWPNRDNVLGPTRPFFSTYLESIWLLQLAVALDLLEGRRGRGAVGDEVRERLLAPSAALIASYDEGRSNRQVYNNAALAAAGALLGDDALLTRALLGPSGIAAQASTALLGDGTWYEGENYHLFAHRGLWYGVTIADALGVTLAGEPLRRVAEGFATPFATALPDFTFPARRDSQYRVSLRQWRMAESCELGLARHDDARLSAALSVLYDPAVPAGDSARARSTAEAERNQPPVRLDRSSLGWKGLLFARAALPSMDGQVPQSVHLAGQGIAVFRRDRARTYVALDYGESGGGHGHPDRLNLWLVTGDSRVLEDVGTGSYVDPTLHWYRSTLAHNAPLVDGRSQARVAGTLARFDEQDGGGIVAARAPIAPGVEMSRTVVTMDGYLVDEVRWRADREVTVDLPWHVDLSPSIAGSWRPAVLSGGTGAEDGFSFLTECEEASGELAAPLTATVGDATLRAWVHCDAPFAWWRCVAPGPPGDGPRRFMLLRVRTAAAVVRSVWSWAPVVSAVDFAPGEIDVRFHGEGHHARDVDRHRRDPRGWRVQRRRSAGDLPSLAWTVAEWNEPPTSVRGVRGVGGADSEMAGATEPPVPPVRPVPPVPPASRRGDVGGVPRVLTLPIVASLPDPPGAIADASPQALQAAVRFVLGRDHYRRSEESWDEAGGPTALVALAATDRELVVDVSVRTPHPCFAPRVAHNPLDNEHPDTNSDGVQLYVGPAQGAGPIHSWLLVPERVEGAGPAVAGVRVTSGASAGPPVPLAARARLTPAGWALRATLPRQQLGTDFTLDLVINEISPGRERRRGQLVLGGARDEWVYLRGDRQDPARAIHIQLADA